MIRIIAATEVFRLDSAVDSRADGRGPGRRDLGRVSDLTRLRPEQVAGAIFQSASLTTLGPQSPWFVRLAAYTGRNDFVRRYGDTGEDEFAVRGGTIPQRLLLMNGELVSEQDARTTCSTPRGGSPNLLPTIARPSRSPISRS